jgi:hypothetical protein
MSHLTRNPPTSLRRLRSALWLTHFPAVRSLFLRHALVAGSTVRRILCICETGVSTEQLQNSSWDMNNLSCITFKTRNEFMKKVCGVQFLVYLQTQADILRPFSAFMNTSQLHFTTSLTLDHYVKWAAARVPLCKHGTWMDCKHCVQELDNFVHFSRVS